MRAGGQWSHLTFSALAIFLHVAGFCSSLSNAQTSIHPPILSQPACLLGPSMLLMYLCSLSLSLCDHPCQPAIGTFSRYDHTLLMRARSPSLCPLGCWRLALLLCSLAASFSVVLLRRKPPNPSRGCFLPMSSRATIFSVQP